jgi:glucuronoarabinoxylan endo-1,4-beta-xylanase
MKILANFPGSGSNQFTVINGFNGISPSISARQFTALECDVRFDPGSATYLRNGAATFGRVEFGMATPGFGQLYFGGAYVPATETGWVHITVPLDPATNVNLLKINNVMVHIWGGTSLAGASTLWVDNLKFTGTTVSGTATVDYADTRQRIDGFGASSAWNSTWSTAEADLFFSTGSNGIGLSLLRSRITPEGTTWETNIMQMAQARGARVWSAPWTPPASYKDSNNVNGGNLIGNATNYQNYANQLANYVASMKTSYGVNLEALSVQNEPNASTTYESCVWTAQQIHDFMPYLADALAARGVAGTKIMLPESMHWEFSLAVPTMADSATAQHVGILGGHNYGSSAAPITQFGTPCPLPLWETEHYIETQNPAANGLELAREIHDFMTVAEANAYHYWWLKGSGTGSLAGNSTATPAKRLYVMGNYSKFVRPGFNRVDVVNDTTALVSAYKDPATQNFVIVAANPTEWPVTQTFDLTGCPAVTSLNQWITSGTLSLASQTAVAVNAGVFTHELPAYSVTTFASPLGPLPLITLKSGDAMNTSSFNAVGNWNDTVAPTGAKDYSAAQYVLRTPTASGNHAFGGHSLTLPPLSILRFKGSNNATITIDKLVLDGGSIENGNGSTTFTFAGNIAVNADSVVAPTTDANRAIQVASNLAGSGTLTNGNGSPGTVTYSGNNDGFTGAMIVNGGAILKVGSQTHLGGNPAYFEPGHLSLDNGIFQPTANFALDRSHSGITLGVGGGTFSINSGLTLTVTNPVSGSGNLTKTGAGVLLLNGTDSHSGTTTVSAGTLTVSGLSGTGTVTAASGATFGGSGMIAGNTTINGTLAPSSTDLTFTGALAFGSTGKVQWKSGGNSLDTAEKITAAAVSVTSGAKIDVVLDSPGSTTNFLHSFWRTTRSFPVIAASSMSGSFTLGTVSADAGGRPVATYGAFTLENSGTGVNLVWTPIPGFPAIDDPTVTLTSPLENTVSLTNNALNLRVSAAITGGDGTTIAWSQVSGPGVATFADPAASDTHVSFPADGNYVLRGTVTNAVGSIYQDFTVLVAPSTSLTLREGMNEYAHAATLIRSDLPTMNSGTRDQIVVGRNGGALRGLLAFDVSPIPAGAAIESVTLDLWSVSAGSGTLLNTPELHELLTTFIEGTGDGSSAANGAGTGADWSTRTGSAADPWAAAGGASGTDYESATLATLAGFNPTTSIGTQYTFGSTAELVSAVSGVAGTAAPLGLMLKMANDTTGGSVFARFGSDNHADIAQRPLLTIGYSVNQTPALATGTAPAAQTGVAASLGGSATNSTRSLWSLVSGPGTATFGDAAQATTTVSFSHPGTYLLRLSAANAFGETSSTLAVNVQDLTPPVITVPSDMTVEATSAAGAVVNFPTSATDAVSGVLTTTDTPASGSTFPLGTTTVTVTASDASGNNASVTFTITVTPAAVSFDSWAAENFTDAGLADSSISGPDATPAGDGLANLLKYALGLPPHTLSVSGVLLEQTGSTWSFTYRRPADRPDISYAVEVCVDPTNGSWTTNGVTHNRIVTGETETWQGSYASEAPENRRFFRLNISKP